MLTASKLGISNEEDDEEWEDHLILRVPEEVGREIQEILKNDPQSMGQKLKLAFTDDEMRQWKLNFCNSTYAGKLVDLPCITETLKTLDKTNFYKVANVCQMLLVSSPSGDMKSESAKKEEGKKKKKEAKMQLFYPHGLTPPMKNVRKRRFRKTLKKKYMDVPELEKQLKSLLRRDLEAAEIRWQIVTGPADAPPGDPSLKVLEEGSNNGTLMGPLSSSTTTAAAAANIGQPNNGPFKVPAPPNFGIGQHELSFYKQHRHVGDPIDDVVSAIAGQFHTGHAQLGAPLFPAKQVKTETLVPPLTSSSSDANASQKSQRETACSSRSSRVELELIDIHSKKEAIVSQLRHMDNEVLRSRLQSELEKLEEEEEKLKLQKRTQEEEDEEEEEEGEILD